MVCFWSTHHWDTRSSRDPSLPRLQPSPRKVIHGKMLSWQPASLKGIAHSLNCRHTQWIFPFLRQSCCIQTQKSLESPSEPPLPFCLSLRLTTEIPSLVFSVPEFLQARIRPRALKSVAVIDTQQAKLPGEISEPFWFGQRGGRQLLRVLYLERPYFNVEIEFQDPHTASHSVGLL